MAHAHKPYLCWCHLPWSGAACGVGYDLHVCVVAYSRDIVSPQAGGGCPQETSGHPPAHGSLPVPPLSPALSMHHHPSVGRWWRLVRQWRSRGHTLRGVPNRFPLRRPAGELCPPTHCVQPPTLLPPRGATWEPPISAQCQGVMVPPGPVMQHAACVYSAGNATRHTDVMRTLSAVQTVPQTTTPTPYTYMQTCDASSTMAVAKGA